MTFVILGVNLTIARSRLGIVLRDDKCFLLSLDNFLEDLLGVLTKLSMMEISDF